MESPLSCQSYAIFWDIENCAIPSMEMASNVVQNLKKFIATKFESLVGQKPEPCVFSCSCDTRKLDARHVEALNRYGVDILHVNNAEKLPHSARKPKVDADCKLMECMQKFTDHHLPKNPIFLITGDIDFAPAIRSAKRRGFQVILLFGNNTSEDLKNSASESHSYHDIISTADREPRINVDLINSLRMPSTVTSNPSAGSPLKVANLMDTQLTELASNLSSIPTVVPNAKPIVHQLNNEDKSRCPPIAQQRTENKSHPQFDDNKLKTIQEVTGVERHIALRILEMSNGDINLAINSLISD